MEDRYGALRDLLTEAGCEFVEPPIIQDSAVFVDLAGEDLRRRLFLTTRNDGHELALRPDYTIPVALAHLDNGAHKRRVDYAYLGPVFRQRGDMPGEFLQAGVESLGRTARIAADADILGLALAAADLLGVTSRLVRIGDAALFHALVNALDISPPWRQRLTRMFGDTDRLASMITGASTGTKIAGVRKRQPSRNQADRRGHARRARIGDH